MALSITGTDYLIFQIPHLHDIACYLKQKLFFHLLGAIEFKDFPCGMNANVEVESSEVAIFTWPRPCSPVPQFHPDRGPIYQSTKPKEHDDFPLGIMEAAQGPIRWCGRGHRPTVDEWPVDRG
jgi:hypothetical protein